MVFLELMRMNFGRQLKNNSGLDIPSLTPALLSLRFQFPHHTFPMILGIPQDLSDSRFYSRTTMLLLIPCGEDYSIFTGVCRENRAIRNCRSEKRRKAEELSFLFSPDVPVTLRVA